MGRPMPQTSIEKRSAVKNVVDSRIHSVSVDHDWQWLCMAVSWLVENPFLMQRELLHFLLQQMK